MCPVRFHMRLPILISRQWRNQELVNEFEDLIKWRDRLAEAGATSYSQFRHNAEYKYPLFLT